MARNNFPLTAITWMAVPIIVLSIGSCTSKPSFGVEFNSERQKIGLYPVTGDIYYNMPEKFKADGPYKYVWNYIDDDKVHTGKTTLYFVDRIMSETDTYTDGKTWRVTYEGHDPDFTEDRTLLQASYFFEASEGWDGRMHPPGWHCWLVDENNQRGIPISKSKADSVIAVWETENRKNPDIKPK